MRIVYAFLSLLLAAYLISWLFRAHASSPLDDWCVGAFEIIAASLCIAKGVPRRRGRAMPLILGLALLSWAAGDITLSVESLGGATPSTPSFADAFYVAFYPTAYVAIVIFMRGQVRRLSTPSWLDGAVAAAGAAAVCAAFEFERILHSTGGDKLATVTNLVYPIGDLLLFSLVVGGSAIMSGQRKTPWILMAGGIAFNIAGDTANLFSASAWPAHLGVVLDAVAWPTSLLLLSMAVWFRPRPLNPLLLQKPTGFVIPGLCAGSALAVLFVAGLRNVSLVALYLATATLVLVGIRLLLSMRGMRALSQERRRLSFTDELTGLGNRRHLFSVLDAFFADPGPAAEPRMLAFLFVDLDHFKEINDAFGHSAGDALLSQLGIRLSACMRDTDLLVRLGGDEFVVLLIDADTNYATTVAQRITDSLTQPVVLDAVQARIGASIGIAFAPTHATDAASLLWCADVAMYRAKFAGAPFAVYHTDLDNGADHLLLLEELKAAIHEHQLILHYQPQLDLRTGEIVAVESLLRWAHPRRGLVPPLEFLPLAEEAGLMSEITSLVLSAALAQCATWRAAGHAVTVAVNISTTDLLDVRFVNLVSDLLQRHGVPAEALVLEITETIVISDFGRSEDVIRQLRELGLVVSIDDFGAGFTSLAYLSSLAVNELKLDRTFISGLTSGDVGRGRDLVHATIDLGHALGLRVVAEGIEDPVSLELLTDLGCDIGQGYFIGRPVPADQLIFDRVADGAAPTRFSMRP
jgi:diguanylate cyclase (GGDEF)-like protein